MKVMDGVGLHGRGVLPAETKRSEAAFHCRDREADLFPQSVRTEVLVAHDTLGIAAAAAARFGAAGDHEGRRRALARAGERECIERRLGRRIDLRADIAARHRIDSAVEQAPLRQRFYVMLVEGSEAIFSE